MVQYFAPQSRGTLLILLEQGTSPAPLLRRVFPATTIAAAADDDVIAAAAFALGGSFVWAHSTARLPMAALRAVGIVIRATGHQRRQLQPASARSSASVDLSPLPPRLPQGSEKQCNYKIQPVLAPISKNLNFKIQKDYFKFSNLYLFESESM